jgi:nitroimidazol reductase NimA-like FMN-containing flavoprotein (pyridoxamine 5'-phosphate oxidase superfamily)
MAEQNSFAPPSPLTTVHRNARRAVYDRAVIDAILDEGLVCHVAFVHEGKPCVIPTAYAREGNWLYLHGAQKNRMLRSICGQTACVSVTLIDGLVLARSAFHHSVNYRSVVLYGEGEEVRDRSEKLRAMERLVEHIVPGRWSEARQPNEQELEATLIVRVPAGECSAKVRTGPPIDDEADLSLAVWAGVLPLTQAWGEPLGDELLPASIAAPPYVTNYRRPAAGS